MDFKPTEGMATEARRALKWKEEGRAGGTQVGLVRANQLVKRENLSEDTVMRMHSFFSRHEVDKRATGFSPGEEGYPSAGRVAWGLWGGDPGQTWASEKRDQIMRERERKALQLVKATTKAISQTQLNVVARAIEDYANANIPESEDAFGKFMYHAELLRNGHLDTHMRDLPMVEQPYRDIIIEILSQI